MPSPGRRCPSWRCMCWWRTRKRASCFRWRSWPPAFRCWAFAASAALARTFARIWSWRDGWAAKAITALSLVFMAYLARLSLRRAAAHADGAISLSPSAGRGGQPDAGRSRPIPCTGRPIIARRRCTPAQLDAAAGQGPGAADVANADPAARHPCPCHAALFGISAGALAMPRPARIISPATRPSPRKARFLKLLPLYWYTLYRLERSATIRS